MITEIGDTRTVFTDDGQPPYEEIRYVHATEAEAKAAAATKKNRGERGQGELSFSSPGDPQVAQWAADVIKQHERERARCNALIDWHLAE